MKIYICSKDEISSYGEMGDRVVQFVTFDEEEAMKFKKESPSEHDVQEVEFKARIYK